MFSASFRTQSLSVIEEKIEGLSPEQKSDFTLDVASTMSEEEKINASISEIKVSLKIINDYLSSTHNGYYKGAAKWGKITTQLTIVSLLLTVVLGGLAIEFDDPNNKKFSASFMVSLLIFLVFLTRKFKEKGACWSTEVPLAYDELSNFFTPEDKNIVIRLLTKLDIDYTKIKLYTVVDKLKSKITALNLRRKNPACKLAFLLGDVPRLAPAMSVSFFKASAFDPKTCDLIFKFANFTELSNQEKSEPIKEILHNTFFRSETKELELGAIDDELENINNIILGYMNFSS